MADNGHWIRTCTRDYTLPEMLYLFADVPAGTSDGWGYRSNGTRRGVVGIIQLASVDRHPHIDYEIRTRSAGGWTWKPPRSQPKIHPADDGLV